MTASLPHLTLSGGVSVVLIFFFVLILAYFPRMYVWSLLIRRRQRRIPRRILLSEREFLATPIRTPRTEREGE